MIEGNQDNRMVICSPKLHDKITANFSKTRRVVYSPYCLDNVFYYFSKKGFIRQVNAMNGGIYLTLNSSEFKKSYFMKIRSFKWLKLFK